MLWSTSSVGVTQFILGRPLLSRLSAKTVGKVPGVICSDKAAKT